MPLLLPVHNVSLWTNHSNKRKSVKVGRGPAAVSSSPDIQESCKPEDVLPWVFGLLRGVRVSNDSHISAVFRASREKRLFLCRETAENLA